AERISGIGKAIAHEEPDLLLAFAVDGARRVLAQGGFTIPSSSRTALREWLYAADPVRAWIAARVTVQEGCFVTTRRAHELFAAWAEAAGFRGNTLPAISAFTQRVMGLLGSEGVTHVRSSAGPRFDGMRIGSEIEGDRL